MYSLRLPSKSMIAYSPFSEIRILPPSFSTRASGTSSSLSASKILVRILPMSIVFVVGSLSWMSPSRSWFSLLSLAFSELEWCFTWHFRWSCRIWGDETLPLISFVIKSFFGSICSCNGSSVFCVEDSATSTISSIIGCCATLLLSAIESSSSLLCREDSICWIDVSVICVKTATFLSFDDCVSLLSPLEESCLINCDGDSLFWMLEASSVVSSYTCITSSLLSLL